MDNEVKRRLFDVTVWTIGLLAGMALIAHEAMAEGMIASPTNERWKAECGSCHVAYPPALLPASTWRRLMSQLDRHFGVDATVDPMAGAEMVRYLERYAGTERRTTASTGSLRVTETRWFSHKHGEVPASIWRLPAVKSASNCAACHTGAEQGDFRHHNIRIPR
jgi:Dihaem cytochrome c